MTEATIAPNVAALARSVAQTAAAMGIVPPEPAVAAAFVATLIDGPPEGRDVVRALRARLITPTEARDLVMAHCATWLSRLRGIEEPPYDLWRTSELEESFALALLGTPDGGQGALQPARGAAAELSPAELAFAAMERAWDDGCRVARPNAETAAVAARRWQSSQRRGVAERDRAARIEDLVKGLIAHVEPDRSMVGRLKVDYEYLATAIANALEPAISNAKK